MLKNLYPRLLLLIPYRLLQFALSARTDQAIGVCMSITCASTVIPLICDFFDFYLYIKTYGNTTYPRSKTLKLHHRTSNIPHKKYI